MKRWLNKFTYTTLGLGLALTATMIAGCSESTETVSKGDKLKVYTTLAAETDFVKQIGKDHVDVVTWLPFDTNVWQWAPTLADQKNLESADIYIRNGVHVEDRWWSQTEAEMKIKNKKLLIVDASQGIEPKYKLQRLNNPDVSDEEKNKERQDPYYYLDPVNAKIEVDAIEAALEKKAPKFKDDFKKNAEDFKKQLDELDKSYQDTLSKVKHKELVSPYPAYQYMAKRYGLTYYVPTTFNSNKIPWDDQPKADALKADLAKHDFKVAFFEEEAAPRVQEFLAEFGYRSLIINPYEGAQDPAAYKTYLEVMRENLKQLELGLNKD
ncbi:metal ABC transporter substrate-binding protein [Tumebacillus permanentifrigoris]|uniref:Zinc transport system substrate-binding protein n=1 Tax=Tumebacillus permanentifrigoris TaxID=378543 RepID=A0A316D285_9BACL|nr:zinc ABC transporter substrate-binding protein [Tumebacillus permanentifrigoris]PWK04972.1 zinc transport system substrate-binding protein [Tumebacillus permanentifrigoris]